MAPASHQGGSHWLARYEVKIDPQLYPHLYERLQRKDAFSEAFASNLERLAGEYIEALEAHFVEEEGGAEETQPDA